MAELLERISSRELTQWMQFYELEPFGFAAGVFGHATTSATLANIFRGKNQEPYKVTDFMPHEGKDEPQTVEQQLTFAAILTAALGGQDLRKDKENE